MAVRRANIGKRRIVIKRGNEYERGGVDGVGEKLNRTVAETTNKAFGSQGTRGAKSIRTLAWEILWETTWIWLLATQQILRRVRLELERESEQEMNLEVPEYERGSSVGISTPESEPRGRSISPFSIARGSPSVEAEPANEAAIMENLSRFRNVMPMPGGPGAPSFEGANVTEFTERYEELCEDFGLGESEVVKRLPRYCESTIGQFIKNLPEYDAGKWKAFKEVLLEEFKEYDSHQQKFSILFLETLMNTPRTEDSDLRQYVRQFSAVSTRLVAKGMLETYTQGVWFLRGLPENTRNRIIRKKKVKIDVPTTINFKILCEEVMEMCASNVAAREFNSGGAKTKVMEGLVKQSIVKTETSNAGLKFGAPVVPVTAAAAVTGDQMADLMDGFKKMTLSLVQHQQSQQGQQNWRPQGQGLRAIDGPRRPGPQGRGGQVNAIAAEGGYYEEGGGVNRMGAYGGPGNFKCWYCGDSGHQKRACEALGEDINKGLCHINSYGKLCVGRYSDAARPIHLYPDITERENILRRWESQGRPTEGAAVGQAPTLAGKEKASEVRGQERAVQQGSVNSIGAMVAVVDYGGEDDGYNPETGDSSSDSEGCEEIVVGNVAAARVETRREPPKKWENASRINKQRQKEEEKFARPKIPKHVGWSEGPLKMDLDESPEPGLPKATPIVATPQLAEKQRKDKVDGGSRKKRETLGDLLKGAVEAEAILDRVLTTELTMTVKELIALSEPMRDLIFKKREVASTAGGGPTPTQGHVNLIALRNPVLVASSPKVKIMVNGGEPLVTILDSGAEMNVITRQAADKFGLAIKRQDRVSMVVYDGNASAFCGICENVEISIGGLRVLQHLYVSESGTHSLLLGQPFVFAVEMGFEYEGACQYAVMKRGGQEVKVKCAELRGAGTEVSGED